MKRVFILSAVIIACFSMCKKDKKNSVAGLSTNTVTDITSNTAKSGGAITDDGGSAITKKGVCWATHTDPTVADSLADAGSGGASFTSNLTGLKANTKYYLKAYASNASGTGYGNEVNFTTSAGIATITTGSVTDIIALSAKSSGNITNDGGASVTERGIVFGTSPNPTIANNKVTAGTGTGSFNITITPLASQQTYYIRAYATNSYGTAYGNQVQFNSASANTVTDIDGNVYPYVTLCDGKSWMASNLKTTKYKNGDAITNGASGFNWYPATTGAYTFPNGEASRKDSLGLLYNVFAMADARGVCPSGWHVPTDAEWQTLEVCQGMDASEAASNGSRGTIGTKFLDGGSTGLNIKKAGALLFTTTSASYTGYGNDGMAYLWTSTTSPTGPNYYRMRCFNAFNDPNPILRQSGYVYASSIRCVKD